MYQECIEDYQVWLRPVWPPQTPYRPAEELPEFLRRMPETEDCALEHVAILGEN
jgi:hypothetical protein